MAPRVLRWAEVPPPTEEREKVLEEDGNSDKETDLTGGVKSAGGSPCPSPSGTVMDFVGGVGLKKKKKEEINIKKIK